MILFIDKSIKQRREKIKYQHHHFITAFFDFDTNELYG